MLPAFEPAAVMTSDDLHRSMEAARIHAELTVQDVWLRYLGLGGSSDAFDIDGYLQGVLTLDAFQENVLAQTLIEALADSYQAYSKPLTTPTTAPDSNDDQALRALITQLLDPPTPTDPAD